jgi:hypothetical protein
VQQKIFNRNCKDKKRRVNLLRFLDENYTFKWADIMSNQRDSLIFINHKIIYCIQIMVISTTYAET